MQETVLPVNTKDMSSPDKTWYIFLAIIIFCKPCCLKIVDDGYDVKHWDFWGRFVSGTVFSFYILP